MDCEYCVIVSLGTVTFMLKRIWLGTKGDADEGRLFLRTATDRAERKNKAAERGRLSAEYMEVLRLAVLQRGCLHVQTEAYFADPRVRVDRPELEPCKDRCSWCCQSADVNAGGAPSAETCRVHAHAVVLVSQHACPCEQMKHK